MFKRIVSSIFQSNKCIKCEDYLEYGDDENYVKEEPIYTDRGSICPGCWKEVEHLFPNKKERKRLF